MTDEGRILQIIPAAPGWRSVCAVECGEDQGIVLEESPLLAFALIEEEDGARWVAPMESYGDYVDRSDQTSNFLGIVGPDQDVEAMFRDQAESHVRREREKRRRAQP